MTTELAGWMRAKGFTADDFEVASDALHDEGRAEDVGPFLRASAVVLGDRLRGLAHPRWAASLNATLGQASNRGRKIATRLKWARTLLEEAAATPLSPYRSQPEDRLTDELRQAEFIRLAGLYVRLLERLLTEEQG